MLSYFCFTMEVCGNSPKMNATQYIRDSVASSNLEQLPAPPFPYLET